MYSEVNIILFYNKKEFFESYELGLDLYFEGEWRAAKEHFFTSKVNYYFFFK